MSADVEVTEVRSGVDELPLSGEPLALDLVNTTFIRGGLRGTLMDALGSPADLDAWLDAHASAFHAALRPRLARSQAGEAQLARFLELRAALREVVGALVNRAAPTEAAVATVNRAARQAGRWLSLEATVPPRAATGWAESDPFLAALGEVAESGIKLITGELAERIRGCPAPGCILYFVKSHTRREWCTAACGNRVRVARHSRRRRDISQDRAGQS